MQRHETGKDISVQRMAGLSGCSDQSLGSTGGKQGGMGRGEKIGLQRMYFMIRSLDFTV